MMHIDPVRNGKIGAIQYQCPRTVEAGRGRDTEYWRYPMQAQSTLRRGRVARICEQCGAGFSAKASAVRKGQGKFCSNPCRYIVQLRQDKIICLSCGTEFVAKRSVNRKYCSQFCGSRISTHGETGSPEYIVWHGIKTRCLNPNCDAYHNYGGRGITICDAWRDSFETFLKDVGRKPSPAHSLDRIDNNQGYYPGNVRWATNLEQNRNRRDNRLITLDGVTKCIKDWAAATGIDRTTIAYRLDRGWSVERALGGLVVTNTTVDPGELVEAPGLDVTESRAVARGCWLVGGGE